MITAAEYREWAEESLECGIGARVRNVSEIKLGRLIYSVKRGH